MIRQKCGLRGFLFASLCCLAAWGQPTVTTFGPSGLQAGTSGTVTFTGRRLAAFEELLVREPGITVSEVTARSDRRLTLRITIASDARVGAHELHLRGRNGLSERLRFGVGGLPQVAAARATGRALPCPITIDGAFRPAEQERFVIDLPVGPVSFEIEGLRLGSRVDTDPVLEILTLDGERITRVDDDRVGRMDPWTTISVARAGPHQVIVRDARWNGSSRHRFRLHVAPGERPAGALPLATGGVRFFHSDRKASDDARATLVDAGPELALAHWRLAGGGSWPRTFRVPRDRAPIHLEDAIGKDPLDLPATIQGELNRRGERDRYQVKVKRGQRLNVRARARILDSPVDTILILRDASGRQLAANDDQRGHPDSSLSYRVRADGVVTIEIRDRLRKEGHGRFYRLEASTRGAPPSVRMNQPRRLAPLLLHLPRGGRAAVSMSIASIDRRQGGRLVPRGLPEGVRCIDARIHPDDARVAVVLEAAGDAPLSGARVGFGAMREGRKEALPLTMSQPESMVVVENDRVLDVGSVTALPLAVTRPARFRIEVEPPQVPIVQDSALAIPVRVIRDEGFEGTVSLRLLVAPPGITANRPQVRGKAEKTTMSLSHRRTIPSEPWTLVVVGTSTDGDLFEVCSEPFRLKVVEPYFRVRAGRVRGRRGEALDWPVTIEPRKEAQNTARLEFPNLPRDVQAVVPAIDGKASRFEVPVTLGPKAAGGRHRNILFRLHVPVEGGVAVQDVRSGEIRVDTRPAPKPRKPGETPTKKKPGTVKNPKT